MKFIERTIMSQQQDIFFCLKNSTIAKIRDLFEWGYKHAMRTDVYFWENTNLDKRPAEETFEEVGGVSIVRQSRILGLSCAKTGTGIYF